LAGVVSAKDGVESVSQSIMETSIAVSSLSTIRPLLMLYTIAAMIDQRDILPAIRGDDDTRAKVRLLKLCLSVLYGTTC
jgi:hypothetical protein